MYTLILEGKEYILRCDLNVVEKIEEKYGGLSSMMEQQGSVACTKFLIAEMINEHYYYIGASERVTDNWVGARLTAAELQGVVNTVISCLADCVCKKK